MPKAAAKSARIELVEPDADFKIEDGIPLPATARSTRPPRYFPFEKLRTGQSFLVSKEKKKGLRPAVRAYYAANPSGRRSQSARSRTRPCAFGRSDDHQRAAFEPPFFLP
jgi:hypothetical protein